MLISLSTNDFDFDMIVPDYIDDDNTIVKCDDIRVSRAALIFGRKHSMVIWQMQQAIQSIINRQYHDNISMQLWWNDRHVTLSTTTDGRLAGWIGDQKIKQHVSHYLMEYLHVIRKTIIGKQYNRNEFFQDAQDRFNTFLGDKEAGQIVSGTHMVYLMNQLEPYNAWLYDEFAEEKKLYPIYDFGARDIFINQYMAGAYGGVEQL